MIVLMLIGGEMGSTAGGIKQYRIITCLKGISHYISSSMKSTKVLHPTKVRKDEQILYLEEKDFKLRVCIHVSYYLYHRIYHLLLFWL